ncbi:abortive infection family protein [Streptomyces sp. SudanB182_2057]|uniref:abortive infection family protein n=1 Tax=Streptomyces sp. SudanB182_2057 TaxID=3035281 RepID=UPI003F5549F8
MTEAWQDHNFAPVPEDELNYDDTSVRRTTFETYAAAVDWTDYAQVSRALLVFEDLLRHCRQSGWEGNWLEEVTVKLERDGLSVDERGRISWLRRPVTTGHLEKLTDPSGILAELERASRTIADDPAATIGSAKQLIEATAKTVPREKGVAIEEHTKVPALVKQAQKALHLDASSVTPGPDSTDAVKKILGGVAAIAIGVAELRNRGYGTGHGQASAPTNLGIRHAQLAANAAITWCQLMLDTLGDPTAPWRKSVVPAQPQPPTAAS